MRSFKIQLLAGEMIGSQINRNMAHDRVEMLVQPVAVN